MRRTTAWLSVFLALAAMTVILGPTSLAGQEVGGDVMMPPPRELGSSAGVSRGPEEGATDPETMVEFRAAIATVLAGVRTGTMSEREARDRLGDVIVSLLVKRRALVFNGRGPRLPITASTNTKEPTVRDWMRGLCGGQ